MLLLTHYPSTHIPQAAATASGRSQYYLLGDGALLELALIQYAMTKLRLATHTLQHHPPPLLPLVIHIYIYIHTHTHTLPKIHIFQNGVTQVNKLDSRCVSLIGMVW